MPVELSPGLHWVEACHDLGGVHKHVAVYLVEGEEGTVLVDSGSFHHREEIREAVADLAPGGVDALVLSHSDYPHSANVSGFVADGAELVASSGAPEKQGLPDARKADIGGGMTVAGREMRFVDPPLADRSHTTWVYDVDTRTLFTADGFGSRHPPDRCSATSADLDGGIGADAVYEFHRHELPWLRYVDPDRLRGALEDVFEAHPPDWVAPIHGHPIAGDDLDRYLDHLTDAAGRIAADFDPERA